MILIYAYIHQYKNFSCQKFSFHKDYLVHFAAPEGTLSISYQGADPIQQALFGNCNVDGLQLLVGKTGSGKTNLLQLLGELEEYRRGEQIEHPMFDANQWEPHTLEGAYFFLYATGPSSYYIESKDIRLPQFEARWKSLLQQRERFERQEKAELRELAYKVTCLRKELSLCQRQQKSRKAKRLKQQLSEYQEVLNSLRRVTELRDARQKTSSELFWTADFSVAQDGTIHMEEAARSHDTLYLNCYDQNAFSVRPYPNSGRNKRQRSQWLNRMNMPYQWASLGGMCRYILEYIHEVEPGDLKRQVALHISNENFEYAINAPLSNAWERALCRWSRLPRKTGQNAKRTDRDIFIHDLWVDYCIYLYKKTRQISLYPNEPLSKQARIEKEARDYLWNKHTFPNVEAAHLPKPDGGDLPSLCEKLAHHLDYLGEYGPNGPLWGIWTDIRDIAQLLTQYEIEYFTPTTFEIPVDIMMDDAHRESSEDLFERMEQYHPDDADLFDHDLLLCHFTHLSAGELQYARIFGILNDHLNAPIQKIDDPKHYIILMDEPDDKMHPELCRQFLRRLLNVCKGSKRGRTCQLMISTHSPFFLSDVAQGNILRLDIDRQTGQGFAATETKTRYFGANIHEIMVDGFFLESTIGEYARSYLIQLQGQLKAVLDGRNTIAPDRTWLTVQRSIVDQIGDDIIRGVFTYLMDEVEAILPWEGD